MKWQACSITQNILIYINFSSSWRTLYPQKVRPILFGKENKPSLIWGVQRIVDASIRKRINFIENTCFPTDATHFGLSHVVPNYWSEVSTHQLITQSLVPHLNYPHECKVIYLSYVASEPCSETRLVRGNKNRVGIRDTKMVLSKQGLPIGHGANKSQKSHWNKNWLRLLVRVFSFEYFWVWLPCDVVNCGRWKCKCTHAYGQGGGIATKWGKKRWQFENYSNSWQVLWTWGYFT